jgi:hypothetical protein
MSIPFEKLPLEAPRQGKEEAQERELSLEEMRERMRDPYFLPSFRALSKNFERFREPSQYDDPEWKEWLELVFDRNNPIFEIWTEEYIRAFGNYLAQRVEELGGTEENPTVILEVGAGNGRLTFFLQEKLNEIMPGKVKIVASDSGDWRIPPAFQVDNIPHKEALAKYKPRIVIFSWMPYGYDCTSDFRASESVDEYILIGESDGGCCGDEWQTWGQNWSFDENERERRKNLLAPYEADGFEKAYMNDLRDLQLSRINISEGNSSTDTVSFKRKE